ncbi:sporulation protein YtxC [Thalassobacillus hwangdonensis]|uniref:Sporulation protein YtxC n=1 Tax=Thalassobacillus hwangdonensis TaxID=546108 RepID=A0ABW3KZL9_9BACI
MIRIFFLSRQETVSFCDFIMQEGAKYQVQWRGDEKGRNEVSLVASDMKHQEIDFLLNIFVQLIHKHRLRLWLDKLIRGSYYYQDNEEVDRIIDICDWLRDSDQRKRLGVRHPDLEASIKQFLRDRIQLKAALSFDDMMSFCFKHHRMLLLDYIGSAIDEFKREEDYQSWVDSLRTYMTKKESLVEEMHVLHRRSFYFFEKNGKRIAKEELEAQMNKEPVHLFLGDREDGMISPLLIYAPKRLFIYGTDPSDPKVQTIINIFQEKALYKPKEQFPFTSPGLN